MWGDQLILERGDTYTHRIKIKDPDDSYALIDPSTVSFSIYDPCNVNLVDAEAMTKDGTGLYHYDYDLDSSATYGMYRVLVTATSGSGEVTITTARIYLLPWDIIGQVRWQAGISEEKSIDDEDIYLSKQTHIIKTYSFIGNINK